MTLFSKFKFQYCLLIICFILICLFFSFDTHCSFASTSENEVISTNIELLENKHYIDMDSVTYFDLNDDYLIFAQLLDANLNTYSINQYNIKTHAIERIIEVGNITYIKCTLEYFFVSSNGILSVYNFKNSQIITLDNVDSYRLIDIVQHGDNILLGIINFDNFFKLYTLDGSLNVSENYQNLTPIINSTKLTISCEFSFVVSGITEENQNRYNIINHQTDTIITKNYPLTNTISLANIKINATYYLIATTNQNLCIINTDETYSEPVATEQFILLTNSPKFDFKYLGKGELWQMLDVKNFNNAIYVSDYMSGFIQKFRFDNTETQNNKKLKADQIMFGSTSSELGRFGDNVEIFSNNSSIIMVADRNNNRLQVFNNHLKTITEITARTLIDKGVVLQNSEITLIEPKSLVSDYDGNYYFIINYNNDKSISLIIKYNPIANSFVSLNSTSLGKICSISVDNNNTLYALLTSPTKSLLKLNGNSFVHINFSGLDSFDSNLINNNSKLIYLQKLNKFLLNYNDEIFLLNLNGEILHKYELSNMDSLSSDFNNDILIKSNNTIQKCNIADNQFVCVSSYENENFENFESISINKFTNQIYAFNHINKSVQILNLLNACDNAVENMVQFTTEYSSSEYVDIKQIDEGAPIYSMPFAIGEMETTNSNFVYVLSTYESNNSQYSQIIYRPNSNDLRTLNVGYVNSSYLSDVALNSALSDTFIRTINRNVSVYAIPSTLRYNENSILKSIRLGTVNMNSILQTTHLITTTIDQNEYYVIIYDDKVGYVNKFDIVVESDAYINSLKSTNGKIKITDGNEFINLYNNDFEPIAEITNAKRIYVENYNANDEYTFICFYDNDLNEMSGYVKTIYVKLDKIDASTLTAIIIGGLGIALGIILLFVFIKYKNKTNS